MASNHLAISPDPDTHLVKWNLCLRAGIGRLALRSVCDTEKDAWHLKCGHRCLNSYGSGSKRDKAECEGGWGIME